MRCQRRPQSLVQPGDVVDGYKVGRLFAKEGGMALLYLVEDPSLAAAAAGHEGAAGGQPGGHGRADGA